MILRATVVIALGIILAMWHIQETRFPACQEQPVTTACTWTSHDGQVYTMYPDGFGGVIVHQGYPEPQEDDR